MKYLTYIILLVSFFLLSCSTPMQQEKDETIYTANTELGIPRDNDDSDDYIISRPQYVLSYNNNLGTANWACYELNKSWYGDASRAKLSFKTDTTLPSIFKIISPNDYLLSGFDRGHIVSAEERSRSLLDMTATFLMTNIMPQSVKLNRGVWKSLETKCKQLCVDSNKRLFVIAGGIYTTRHTLKNEGKVSIPDYCYKIVIIINADQSWRNIDTSTRVIAVMMPNDSSMIYNKDYNYYRTTIKSLQASSNYNFIDRLPDHIEAYLESKNY